MRTDRDWAMIERWIALRSLRPAPRSPRQIAILLYPGVQSLDFTGPLEVFSGAQRLIEDSGRQRARARLRGAARARSCSATRPLRDLQRVDRDPAREPRGRAGEDRHADRPGRLRLQGGDGRPGAAGVDLPDGRERPAHRLGLHRRLPARRGRPARRPARDHALGLRRRARRPVPGGRSRPRADLPARRADLDLGRRHRGHGPGARARRGRSRPRRGARDRAPSRAVPAPSRQPVAVQRDALRAGARARAAARGPAPRRRASGGRPVRRGARRARPHEPAALRPRVRGRDGVTPARYVERVRLEAARRRLEDTAEPIAAVASACGFGTAETMRRAFLRALEVGPAEYRRRFHAPIERRRE